MYHLVNNQIIHVYEYPHSIFDVSYSRTKVVPLMSSHTLPAICCINLSEIKP